MSAPSLADPVLADQPVASVVRKLVDQLGVLEAENAELRHQLGRHSGNSGQPPSQDGPQASPRTRSRRQSRRHRLMSVSTTGRRGKAVAG